MLNTLHFTDDLIASIMDGSRVLTTEERNYLVTDTTRFEECPKDVAAELPTMSDGALMRTAYDIWCDYASGQV